LNLEAKTLELPSLSQKEAIEIGEIALDLGFERSVPIAVEARLIEWVVIHACPKASLEAPKSLSQIAFDIFFCHEKVIAQVSTLRNFGSIFILCS
jgi:hypothetical protein